MGIWNIMVKVAPYTFGVYLIHDNLLMRDWLWSTIAMTSYADQWVYPLAVMVVCLFIYVICTLIEVARKQLFALLRIDDIILKLDSWSYFSKLFT